MLPSLWTTTYLTEFRKECPECDGTGECIYEQAVPMSASNPYGYLRELTDICECCGGTGQVLDLD